MEGMDRMQEGYYSPARGDHRKSTYELPEKPIPAFLILIASTCGF
jgi:hypothetical protein